MIKLANNDYRGEQFVTDGDKVSVAATTSSHKWSDLGEFVKAQDQIVREGLLGGESDHRLGAAVSGRKQGQAQLRWREKIRWPAPPIS